MKGIAMNHLKRSALICGAIMLQLSLTAHAIVNVEQAVIGQPPEGVHTSVDLLANGASGNTEKSSTRMDVLSLWQHEQYTEFAQLQYAYGKSRGVVDTDRAFAHLRHRTAITPVWGVEAFAQVGRDPFARLAQRTLLGGGMRRVLFEADKKSAGYLGFGAFHEHEVLNSMLGTSDPLSVSLWRANTYLVLKGQINEQVRVYSTTYYQPAVKDTRDFRALEQASMLVRLHENLDLKLSLDIAFDSRPPQTVQKNDTFYSTGLEYSF
jgi:putative salt-induced outer membrane protein YdiY